MTRINCIPPQDLTDKHLVAEYRELPRLAKHAAAKYVRNPDFEPPSTYRLGKGHMDFFVDKGAWLASRHAQLVQEMTRRGFRVNFPEYPDIHPECWRGTWEPTEDAIAINLQRIKERLNA